MREAQKMLVLVVTGWLSCVTASEWSYEAVSSWGHHCNSVQRQSPISSYFLRALINVQISSKVKLKSQNLSRLSFMVLTGKSSGISLIMATQ